MNVKVKRALIIMIFICTFLCMTKVIVLRHNIAAIALEQRTGQQKGNERQGDN